LERLPSPDVPEVSGTTSERGRCTTEHEVVGDDQGVEDVALGASLTVLSGSARRLPGGLVST
jgi:hypothetical protein